MIHDNNLRFSAKTSSNIKEYVSSIGEKVIENLAFGELLASVHFMKQIYTSEQKVKSLIAEAKRDIIDGMDLNEITEICNEQLH